MSDELLILTLTALSVGFFHTVLGPDHYLPFVVMSKAGNWPAGKTLWITTLCGLGHVGSSVILGLAGIAIGLAVSKLEWIESFRGNLAAWFLIVFGLLYMVWGLRKAFRGRPHSHRHFHGDGTFRSHEHSHSREHLHIHEKEQGAKLTPWILFTIFVFGPCEPLIPVLMYPASYRSAGSLLWIVFVFSAATILTMVSVVLLMRRGFGFIPATRFERFGHAMAGGTICLCGLAIQFLGL